MPASQNCPILADPADCTGCAACAAVCPTNAITMIEDGDGFLYPAIDERSCSDCGLCTRTCPMLEKVDRQGRKSSPVLLAAWHKDADTRISSTSGGVFSALATVVLDRGGVVFGASYDKDLRVRHEAVSDRQGLPALKGSKYLQSDVGDVYVQTRQRLLQGQSVLFSGTPCQIAGLYAFLGQEYPSLYTCDLICHSTPSPKVWRTYLDELESHSGTRAVGAVFRDKRRGWKTPTLTVRFESKREHTSDLMSEAFYLGFVQGLFSRPACSSCAFRGTTRMGDLTIADFWDISMWRPDLDDNRGTSLVIVNTSQGEALFADSLPNLFATECPMSYAMESSRFLVHSTPPHRNRLLFFSELGKLPLSELVAKCLEPVGQ